MPGRLPLVVNGVEQERGRRDVGGAGRIDDDGLAGVARVRQRRHGRGAVGGGSRSGFGRRLRGLRALLVGEGGVGGGRRVLRIGRRRGGVGGALRGVRRRGGSIIGRRLR